MKQTALPSLIERDFEAEEAYATPVLQASSIDFTDLQADHGAAVLSGDSALLRVNEGAEGVAIQDCLNGDADSFSKIVEKYQKLIQKQMRWYARDAATCEELVHDVFVQAYMSLSTYSAKAPFRHWLRKIASHVGYRHLKKLEKDTRFLRLEDWDIVSEPEQQEAKVVDEGKAKKILYGLLERLCAEDRTAVTMMYFERLGTQEIAERMGWSRAMVKMHVYRAKKKLRQIVQEEGLIEKYDLL